ncbi:hypothetical protein ARMGADRAFT_868594, partial [Armillaria gallica]
DSGADISLISEELYNSLKKPPPVQKGNKLKLWQLMDKDAEIQGYVKVTIFMESRCGGRGSLIQTEVEVYLVPKMSVPILLGKDYQINYKLTIKWSLQDGTSISYGGQPEYTFIRAHNHRREKNRRAQAKKKHHESHVAIRAKTDVKIKPHTCQNVAVDRPFNKEQVWVVERNLVPLSASSYVVVLNVLISLKEPVVP